MAMLGLLEETKKKNADYNLCCDGEVALSIGPEGLEYRETSSRQKNQGTDGRDLVYLCSEHRPEDKVY